MNKVYPHPVCNETENFVTFEVTSSMFSIGDFQSLFDQGYRLLHIASGNGKLHYFICEKLEVSNG